MDATVEVEDEPGAILNGGHRDPLQPNKTIHIAAFIAVLAAIVFTLFKKWRTREFASRDNATRVEVELTEDAIKRREAIEAVRTRMQERFNQDAERFKQMMAEEEERRAQRRAEVLEAMSCGRSCKLDNQQAESKDKNPASGPKRSKRKSILRPHDYNPLMGDTSFSRFRPTSRFSGG